MTLQVGQTVKFTAEGVAKDPGFRNRYLLRGVCFVRCLPEPGENLMGIDVLSLDGEIWAGLIIDQTDIVPDDSENAQKVMGLYQASVARRAYEQQQRVEARAAVAAKYGLTLDRAEALGRELSKV